jgi:LacI family transcriptional regulator
MIISLEECHRLGHRRLGLVVSSTVNEKVQRRWLAASLLAQNQFPDLPVIEPLVTDALTEPVFRAWFRRQRPHAIITPSPLPLLPWLERGKIRVPRDVGIVSLSVPLPGDRLSGIYQNSGQIGRRSIDTLITLLERNELGLPALPDTLLVDGTWNPGQTLRSMLAPARVHA